MKFFIDTANVEDIRKANDMGVICGVTTMDLWSPKYFTSLATPLYVKYR